MSLYTWGQKFYTEEEIDVIILHKKDKAKKNYAQYCEENKEEGPPFIDEFDKVCHGAEYLGDGGGFGLFIPETEEEWDERMSNWKEALKCESEDEYYDSTANCYATYYYEAGKGIDPVITIGDTKQFPHYYLLRNKAEFGDALKGIGGK